MNRVIKRVTSLIEMQEKASEVLALLFEKPQPVEKITDHNGTRLKVGAIEIIGTNHPADEMLETGITTWIVRSRYSGVEKFTYAYQSALQSMVYALNEAEEFMAEEIGEPDDSGDWSPLDEEECDPMGSLGMTATL